MCRSQRLRRPRGLRLRHRRHDGGHPIAGYRSGDGVLPDGTPPSRHTNVGLAFLSIPSGCAARAAPHHEPVLRHPHVAVRRRRKEMDLEYWLRPLAEYGNVTPNQWSHRSTVGIRTIWRLPRSTQRRACFFSARRRQLWVQHANTDLLAYSLADGVGEGASHERGRTKGVPSTSRLARSSSVDMTAAAVRARPAHLAMERDDAGRRDTHRLGGARHFGRFQHDAVDDLFDPGERHRPGRLRLQGTPLNELT
jgi:hypothetical protein